LQDFQILQKRLGEAVDLLGSLRHVEAPAVHHHRQNQAVHPFRDEGALPQAEHLVGALVEHPHAVQADEADDQGESPQNRTQHVDFVGYREVSHVVCPSGDATQIP
jgi:hypothetical protein